MALGVSFPAAVKPSQEKAQRQTESRDLPQTREVKEQAEMSNHIEEVWTWVDGANGRQKLVLSRSFEVRWYENGTRSYENKQTGERSILFVRLTLLSKRSDEHKRVRVQGFISGRLESNQEWNIDKARGEHYGPLSGYLPSQKDAIALSFDHLQSRVMYPTL